MDYKAGNKNCVARLQNAEVCEKAKKELLDATINGKKIKPFILRGMGLGGLCDVVRQAGYWLLVQD